jgi:hypothetical protein
MVLGSPSAIGDDRGMRGGVAGMVLLMATAVSQLAAAEPSRADAAAPLQLAYLATDFILRWELVGIHAGEDGFDADTGQSISTRLTLTVPIADEVVHFGTLPLAHFRETGYSAETDHGNVTIGGRWIHRRRDVALGAGAAAALPTAPDLDLFSSSNGLATRVAGVFRFDRGADFFNDTIVVRFTGDARMDRGEGFVQVELAYERWDMEFVRDDIDLLHFDVSGGVRLAPSVALHAELTTVSLIVDEPIFDDGESWYHWLYFGLRNSGQRASLGTYLFVPFDAPGSDTYDALGLGIDVIAPL